jgi:RNA recognition motif-containing protein
MNIFIGNLSYDATDEDLMDAFKSFGEVTSATIITDRYSGNSKGFGFVEMPSKAEAQSAINILNGESLKGKRLNVNEARPRTDNHGGSGNRGNSIRGHGGGRYSY